jgi:hypothetical protein
VQILLRPTWYPWYLVKVSPSGEVLLHPFHLVLSTKRLVVVLDIGTTVAKYLTTIIPRRHCANGFDEAGDKDWNIFDVAFWEGGRVLGRKKASSISIVGICPAYTRLLYSTAAYSLYI